MRIRETIIRIVLMSLLLYSVVSFVSVKQDIQRTEQFALELEQELELLLVENQDLHRKISSGGDDDVIRALAHERLGLVMPEDTVFYFTRDRREK